MPACAEAGERILMLLAASWPIKIDAPADKPAFDEAVVKTLMLLVVS